MLEICSFSIIENYFLWAAAMSGATAVTTISTKPQLNAIDVIDWAISSMSALLGIKKLTMPRTLMRKRRC
jgi:hypothetical protein